MSQKTILVTGGAGLIGSNLCKRLLDDGHIVYCVDNFYSSSRIITLDVTTHPNYFLFQEDITSDIFASRILKNNVNQTIFPTFDWIFHLACPASPALYQQRPFYTMQVCLKGSALILDLARQDHARIVLASTSEIYGEPAQHPQTEKYNGNVSTLGIRSCYDEGKRAMEAMAMAHSREFGTDISLVRIFNTYGPGMRRDDGRVVSNFITQALSGNTITIYGDGTQSRSFCYVDDLVQGLIKMMESNQQGPINLGNSHEITINELALIVREQISNKIWVLSKYNYIPEIVYKNLPEDDPSRRCPDISKARSLLDWSPTTGLEEGIEKTINSFCDRIFGQ